MSQLSTFIVILLSLGALQGTIYGVLLWRKKADNKTANRLIALLLFCFSYRLLNEVLLLLDVGRYDWWYHLTQETNWLYGPLIYLFVKAWLNPDFRVTRKDWLHFSPFILEILLNNFVRTQNFYWDGTRESLSWAGYWGYVVWMNYPFKYLVAAMLLVVYGRAADRMVVGSPELDKMIWLHRILQVFWWYFAVILGIVAIDFAINFDSSFGTFYYYFTRFYYYPLFVGIAGLTYWLALEGYHRARVPSPKAKAPLAEERRAILEQLAEQIHRAMDEAKLYQNPDLSLASLASEMKVKPYLISQCFKEVMHTRFNDYINQLRIGEFKRLLQSPNKEHYTIISLAYEAGFNSKASLHRAVKKFEGLSPGALRDKIA